MLLGPLLFLIYVDEARLSLSDGDRIVLYADDLLLLWGWNDYHRMYYNGIRLSTF